MSFFVSFKNARFQNGKADIPPKRISKKGMSRKNGTFVSTPWGEQTKCLPSVDISLRQTVLIKTLKKGLTYGRTDFFMQMHANVREQLHTYTLAAPLVATLKRPLGGGGRNRPCAASLRIVAHCKALK